MFRAAVSLDPRMVLFRGLVWSIIGLIYAPLFCSLELLFRQMGLGAFALAPAAALAGAAGAALYGARQVALAAGLVGVVAAVLLMSLLQAGLSFWHVAAFSAGTAMLAGLLVLFPDRCSHNVPGKALAGFVTGLAMGLLLALVEPFHDQTFRIAGVAAFLVSANGVLYVASVGWWVRHTTLHRSQPCRVIQSLVMAVLGGLAGGSLWLIAGPIVGDLDQGALTLVARIQAQMPMAMMGGALGGAVGGSLLEAFGFRWVHDIRRVTV